MIENSKLLKSLLQSKSHYGARCDETRPANKNFIYGVRFQQTILNLHYTIQSIKRAFLLIEQLLKLKPNYFHKSHKILIICNNSQTRFFFHSNLQQKGPFEFVNENWVGGFLTNPTLLQERLKNVRLVLAFNVVRDNLLTKAMAQIDLPLISITNTHLHSNSISYPIFFNAANSQSIFFFCFLFKKYLKSYETK